MTPWIELSLLDRAHRLLSLGSFTTVEIAFMLNASIGVIRKRLESLHLSHRVKIVGSQRKGNGRAWWVWGLV